ncbi:MAG: C-GCAxxG-C-C family protein [Eubacteriales bacterium]|nr:C-GCAxxG-C-C family protein [Eubacteriales bacterium]
MDRVSAALAAFQSGFHCTQAVFSAFCEDLGLERSIATRLAECFGGTVCNTGMPCGALLGAYLAIGLYAGRSEPGDLSAKFRTEALRARLAEGFTARFGAADCRTLLGCDITKKEGLEAAYTAGAMARCADFVAYAAELTDKLLRE